MVCSNCMSKLPGDVATCPGCGASVTPASAPAPAPEPVPLARSSPGAETVLQMAAGPPPVEPFEQPERGGSALLGALLVLAAGVVVDAAGLALFGDGPSWSIRTSLVGALVAAGVALLVGRMTVRIRSIRRRRWVAAVIAVVFFAAELAVIEAALEGWVDVGLRSFGPILSAVVAGVLWGSVPRSRPRRRR